MAKISSRLLSASWKLNHGFAMSVSISGLDEIRYYLRDLLLVINTPSFWHFQLYSDLVELVRTNKPFETDEEFQRGYEHPPAESQVSAFASTLGEAEAMLKETLGQIRQLVQPEGERPEQEEVSASSSAHDEAQETLGQIRQLVQPEGERPEQEKVSASSSAHDEAQGAEKELEESEVYTKICGVKGRIDSFVGDMKTFCELLKNFKISEC
jgi:hypothetical protein